MLGGTIYAEVSMPLGPGHLTLVPSSTPASWNLPSTITVMGAGEYSSARPSGLVVPRRGHGDS